MIGAQTHLVWRRQGHPALFVDPTGFALDGNQAMFIVTARATVANGAQMTVRLTGIASSTTQTVPSTLMGTNHPALPVVGAQTHLVWSGDGASYTFTPGLTAMTL